MKYEPGRALELLRLGTGRRDAQFREGQESAIRHIVEGRGWPKSISGNRC